MALSLLVMSAMRVFNDGADCVSFTADLCRASGMTLPAINFTPAGFLQFLTLYNKPTGFGRTSGDW